MQIYIPTITHKNWPFVWDYNQEENQLICSFTVKGKKKNFPQIELIASLACIEGIKITHDKAIITDAENFLKIHTYHVLMPFLNLKQLHNEMARFFNPSSHDLNRRNTTTENSPPSELLEGTPLLERTASEPEPAHSINKICIDSLFNESSLRAETSIYNVFLKKTKSESEIRKRCIYSVRTIFNQTQYEKNKELYPIKRKQMQIIQNLFDKRLAPVFEQMLETKTLSEEIEKKFVNYFQNAILKVMRNKPLNAAPTLYDLMSQSERLEIFPTDNHFNRMVKYARAAVAKYMLMELNYLISPEIKLELDDNSFANYLSLFKTKLYNQQREIARDLAELESLIIESGQTEYRYNLIEEKVKAQLLAKEACINQHFSCHYLLTNQLHLSKDTASKIISKLCDSLTKLDSARLSRLFSDDEDFYLCKEWADELKLNLKLLSKKSKVTKTKIIELVDKFIKRKCSEHLEENPEIQPASALSAAESNPTQEISFSLN